MRGVLTVTLNLPKKKNALSAEMIADLTQVASFVVSEAKSRVMVLRGAGDIFCAGGDLSEFGSATDLGEAHQIRQWRMPAGELAQVAHP